MAHADTGCPTALHDAGDGGPPGAGVASTATMTVCVVYAAAPHTLISVPLQLPVGASALVALRTSGLGQQLASAELDGLRLGLWGRLCASETSLADGDRLELLRPLLADPMESRRHRVKRDGVRKVKRRA